MVKGISRQVIVVQAPDPKLFEQAIFILREDAAEHGVTDEALLKEAQKVIGPRHPREGAGRLWRCGPVWAAAGALATGLTWLLTVLL